MINTNYVEKVTWWEKKKKTWKGVRQHGKCLKSTCDYSYTNLMELSFKGVKKYILYVILSVICDKKIIAIWGGTKKKNHIITYYSHVICICEFNIWLMWLHEKKCIMHNRNALHVKLYETWQLNFMCLFTWSSCDFCINCFKWIAPHPGISLSTTDSFSSFTLYICTRSLLLPMSGSCSLVADVPLLFTVI